MIKYAVFLGLLLQITHQEGCNIFNLRVWDSVVLNTNFEILYPPITNDPSNRNVTVPKGGTIIISCNGGYFKSFDTKSKTILATCNQNSQLEVQDTIIDFDKIDCVNFDPVEVITTERACAPNSSLIEVGFRIGLNIKFVPQIVICFDYENLVPVYAGYNLTKSIGFIKSYLQTSYAKDTVNVGVDFDTLYDFRNYQLKAINALLGLDANSTEYIDPDSCNRAGGNVTTTPGFCFTRRPLTYRGHLVYVVQQHAAYRYINVVPQWSFLDYNLDKTERDVSEFVKNQKLDLVVYRGTYGIATLPHADTGDDVELFLYAEAKKIPVPLIFWMLIYDPVSQGATVLLTVNDPYQTDVSKNVICQDISDRITWLTWEKLNVTKGYSYACTYEDAKTTITYLPEIEVKGTLGTMDVPYFY